MVKILKDVKWKRCEIFLKAFKKGFVCNNSLKHSVFKYSMLTFQFGCYDYAVNVAWQLAH